MKKNPVGRPALKESEKKRIKTYKLSPGFLERFERLIPEGKRGQFIEEVVSDRLDMIEGKKPVHID